MTGAVLLLVVALAVLAFIVWWWWRHTRERPTTYGGNPNPAYITDEMWWLWEQMLALEPTSKLGGIYANKAGYHNCRRNLPSYDYSVCDRPPDDGGPGDKAAAIDWTFPDAQGGNYDRIAKYTKRLLASAQDLNDPRLNGWREFYGNADDDSHVEGWDCRYGYPVTSDSSHLWHIHLSESRDMTTSMDNKKALVSVLKGETLAQWLAGPGGGGPVLISCPYDPDRLDLFYVGANKEVRHRWWWDGIDTAWSTNTKNENLGGSVEVGTLTAAWASNGDSINIAGLGAADENAPAGCGQYWSMNLNRSGTRSGWGSHEQAYGKLPATVVVGRTAPQQTDHRPVVLAVLAVLVALFAIAYVVWGPR